jgi:signal transduction histidine kinase/CheY-like chemotaxis protein
MAPSMKKLALESLVSSLAGRFEVVQTFTCDEAGNWEIYSGPSARCEQAVPACDLLATLAWLDEAQRTMVGSAIYRAVKAAAGWSGRCGMTDAVGVSQGLDVEVTPLGFPLANSCLLIARRCPGFGADGNGGSDRQEQWALAAPAAGLGLVIVERADRVVRLDATAARQLGITVESEIVLPVSDWLNLLASEVRRRVFSLLVESGPDAHRIHSLSVPTERREGRTARMLELSLRGSANGTRWIGASRDVTKERLLEDFRRKKLAAERANKAKSEFMSQVSHELRTPLNGILGFAQLMLLEKHNALTGEQLKRAEVLMYSGQRLLGLIDQLLEVARVEHGRHSLKLRSVNVASILQRTVEQLQPMAERSNVALIVEIERPERAAVRADPAALEQVIVNLAANAIKYNRPNGYVRLAFGRDNGGVVLVEDSGRGMTDSEMGRLFEPFNRLNAQHSKVPGYGLGLAISRKLVEAMGGELRVQSTPEVGSAFSVHLPMASVSRFDATETLPLELPTVSDDQRLHKVLYVEDDEVNTLLMQQVFATQPRWSLLTVTSGVEAMRSAVREGPHLILLDLHLPDMSGLEVFKRLQVDSRTKLIPCIAVSADAMPAQVRRALSEGFDEHWSKPLDLHSVLRKLKEKLASR